MRNLHLSPLLAISGALLSAVAMQASEPTFHITNNSKSEWQIVNYPGQNTSVICRINNKAADLPAKLPHGKSCEVILNKTLNKKATFQYVFGLKDGKINYSVDAKTDANGKVHNLAVQETDGDLTIPQIEKHVQASGMKIILK